MILITVKFVFLTGCTTFFWLESKFQTKLKKSMASWGGIYVDIKPFDLSWFGDSKIELKLHCINDLKFLVSGTNC